MTNKKEYLKNIFIKIFFITLLFLTSCRSVEIAQNLTQYETHRIITELNQKGISSYSLPNKSNKGKFSVYVSRHHRLAAISIINKQDLLPKPETDFNELTKAKGFLPNSRALENIRLDRALALEIQEVLQNHPQIEKVNVIVRVNYLEKNQDFAVSALIVTKDKSSFDIESIREIILNSVPGVDEDKIKINIGTKNSTEIFGQIQGLTNDNGRILATSLVPFLIWQVPEGVEFELGIGILGLVLIIGILGYFLGVFRAKPKHTKALINLPDSSKTILRIEDGNFDDKDNQQQ